MSRSADPPSKVAAASRARRVAGDPSHPEARTAVKRVGHKGADTVAPGNTIESFEAARKAGVDMVEFDVLRLADGRLVLAHDSEEAATRDPLGLDDALDHFAGEAYADVEFDVDLKLPGYEHPVVEGLAARGLSERAMISSTWPESLDRVGELAPGLRRGWSVPRVRRDYTKTVLAPLAYAILRYWRARLPGRAAVMLDGGRCEAIMAHFLLTSPRLVQVVKEAGGQLFVWTVDEAERLERLIALGVDGVITNDPRLFGA